MSPLGIHAAYARGTPLQLAPGSVTVQSSVDIRKGGKVDVTACGFSDAFGPTKVIQRLRLPK
jgi:hypothetical protein